MSISNDLTVKQIKKLFKMFCIHKVEYEEDKRFPDNWKDCKSCILRDIPWQLDLHSPIFRDLCFAIWHENILNGIQK